MSALETAIVLDLKELAEYYTRAEINRMRKTKEMIEKHMKCQICGELSMCAPLLVAVDSPPVVHTNEGKIALIRCQQRLVMGCTHCYRTDFLVMSDVLTRLFAAELLSGFRCHRCYHMWHSKHHDKYGKPISPKTCPNPKCKSP